MIIDGEEWFSDMGRAYALRRKEARAKGLTEGWAEALSIVLEARGLDPTAAQRARIGACRNRKQLEQWLRRAVLAKSVAEILRERPPSRGGAGRRSSVATQV